MNGTLEVIPMKKRTFISLLLVGVILGAAVSYGVAYATYQSKIDGYKGQISNLVSEKADLEAELSSTQSAVTA